MSNNPIPPPLPYWGSNYTQPWASHPPSSGAVPHNMQYHPNPSAATPAPQNVESFYANANLPGFGGPGTNGSFPPPFAFPGAFPPAPGPPHFPTLPDMSYPLMPMPPTLSNVPPTGPPTNEFIHSAQSNTADSRPMGAAGSQLDLDREEGELTDIEGPNMAVEQHVPGSRKRHPRGDAFSSRKIHTTRDARNKRKQPAQAKPNASKELDLKNTHQSAITAARYRGSSSSDLEEGEASPGRPHSSRNSGSPYNPPMPIEPGSPFVSKSIRERPDPPSPGFETVDNSLPTSTISQISPDSGKPLVPLRVQAQGALLSLAPHNIRYHELVGEGIDPIILKQLYEEIGIKVPTTPLTELGTAVSSHDEDTPLAGPGAVDRQAKKSPQELEPQRNAVQSSTPVEPTAAPVQPVQANTAKPMERKEVIARMLAAKKAAKLSPASVPSQADRIPSPPSVPAAVEASTVPTPSQDPSSKDRESRVKEKNKAQTELARQRIEQLKKQGLIRSQQKLQPDSQLLAKEQGDSGLESSAANLTIVKHPLPERPPVPETASSDRIPGLFMTEQASEVPNDADTTLVQDFPLDAVSQPRTSQRKRPRASDFDDLVPISKRTYSNGTIYTPPERLIIDISDDETYDNDEDVAMQDEIASRDLIVSASDSLYPPPIDSLPHRPATSQSQAFSNSSTPNNLRNSEQEDLRKKNLEIQAMHRRIAELEQRKKARLASRTQSPRNSDVSPPEPVSLPFVSLPTPPNPSDNVDNIMTPLDAENLRKMKAKILRAQEIEAGVPSLDAEIQKSEAKLSDFKREEEMLLSELERGKEGRQQLLDELSTLKSELNGLSLDQVNTALIRLETKEELPVEVVQGMLRRLSIPGPQPSNIATYESHPIAPGYATEPSVQSAVATPEVSEADVHVQEDINSSQHADLTTQETPPAASLSNSAGISEDANVANGPEDEQSDTSMSEDSSSAMDESSDESGSSSASVHEEMPDAQHHSTEPVNPPDVNATTTQEIPHNLNAENQHEHSPTNSEDQSDIVAGFGEDLAAEAVNRPASRESSVSEAYEPPEPEESSSSSGSDSSYSPAPSPNPPGPATNMDVSGPLEDPPQEAGEPLTGKVQELDFQQPSQYSQIDILDNARCPEDTQHSFSPYVSPLRLFKSYRFHPSYNDEVSDSYRSLTYSHNIDPLKSLCPFESSGGVCNDRSCEFQHFRDMALSGASTPEQ
ncbi:hypothetical protein BJY01DRAFT_225435 [Aspergillus pseudoustus]|uniref:Putative zinc-finger domain-containing protein n=1 Tax=Aspergillus pseudoustus TaxID=1810923 RepID=A0ABR4IZE7_9EURO